MYEPKYDYELRGRSGFKYILQAPGLVFKLDRLLAGAGGFILSSLVYWAFAALAASLVANTRSISSAPMAIILIVIGTVLSLLVMQFTSAVISRSVKCELMERKTQSFVEGMAFLQKNIKALGLYALAFMGMILISYIAVMIILVLGRIPAIGPILYGIVLFPASVVISIGIIISILVLLVSFFVFPAHVAVEEMPLIDTIRNMFLLVRYRGIYLVLCQLVSSLLVIPIALIALAIAYGGLFQVIGLSGMVMQEDFAGIIRSVVETFPILKGIIREALGGLSLMLYGRGEIAGYYSFAAALVGMWLMLFLMASFSFSFSYMSVAGALTYLSVKQLPVAVEQSEGTRARTTSHKAVENNGALVDVGGGWNGGRAEVSARGVRIGRMAPCEIVIDAPHISREHALITIDGEGKVVLIDQKSTNGTYVNGQKVDRIRLNFGDVVRLGNDEMTRFEYTRS
jgi:hypothetical protein